MKKKIMFLSLLFITPLFGIIKEVELDGPEAETQQDEATITELKQKEQGLRKKIRRLRAERKKTEKINIKIENLEEQLGEVVGSIRVLRRR